jgi:hypothetical protein
MSFETDSKTSWYLSHYFGQLIKKRVDSLSGLTIKNLGDRVFELQKTGPPAF